MASTFESQRGGPWGRALRIVVVGLRTPTTQPGSRGAYSAACVLGSV
jgi:hypothetical protein